MMNRNVKSTHLLAISCLVSVMAVKLQAQPPAHTLNDPTRPVYHLVCQATIRNMHRDN
jgi:hypothetical protein